MLQVGTNTGNQNNFKYYYILIIFRNTTVADYYEYSVNETNSIGYYYLNTFDNLVASYMTLFELTVVNNWFILMNAYAVTVGMYTRAYFMIFYLVTMIVLTIVVSSFLEAFRFRIQYKKTTSKVDGETSNIIYSNDYATQTNIN